MKNIKVSCIVPIYNTEDYLEDTIGSILTQTLTDIEVILVDDVSTDRSWDIINNFAEKDDRIQLIRQKEHVGAAVCRNTGLEYASGKYLMFLDSDDYFYPNMFMRSFEVAEKEMADMVVFSYQRDTMDENNNLISSEMRHINARLLQKSMGRDLLDSFTSMEYAPWNRMVRREYMLAEKIRFQDLPNNNDVFYSLMSTLLSHKNVFLDEVLLKHYAGRKGSLTSTRRKCCDYLVQAYDGLYIEFKKRAFDEEFIREFLKTVVAHLRGRFQNPQEVYEVKKFISDSLSESCFFKELNQYFESVDLEYLWCKNFVTMSIKKYSWEYLPQIIDVLHGQNKKLALWGCGKRGKIVLDEITLRGKRLDYVIDLSEHLHGRNYREYKITDYQSVCDEVDVIFITNKAFEADIKKLAPDKKIVMIW